MGDYLDVRTLAFVSALISAVLCLLMAYIYVARKTYPGFGSWLCGVSFHAAGMLLLALRGDIPDIFSVIGANLFLALFLVFLTRGTSAFVGVPQRTLVQASSMTFLVAGAFYFTYVTPSVSSRIVLFSAILAVYGVWLGWVIAKRIPVLLHGMNWFLIVVVGIFVCGLVARIMLTLLLERDTDELMSPSLVQGTSLVVFAVLDVAFILGLVILNFQRVEDDLMRSMDEIKTLRGIIPICASCKKIRDDQGYWKQLEAYMRDHADVTFSHGICPECREKLYAKLDTRTKEAFDGSIKGPHDE
jgi:hypothetical protein